MQKNDSKRHEKQLKSKKRVAEHGEVFTPDHLVRDMLDLVKTETERIESRFLEQACGDGNFLAEILLRKLDMVKKRYRRLPSDFEKFSVIALSSLYGVDILQDNVQECRQRLYNIWDGEYTRVCKREATDLCRKAARYILDCNILWGNALDMTRDGGEPIIFAQWDLISGTLLKRRDYRLDVLLASRQEQLSMGDPQEGMAYDPEVGGNMPTPIREYPPTDYRKVWDHD